MKIVKVGKYENGDKYVEFKDAYATPYAKMSYTGFIDYEWKDTWRLVESNLLMRIENMKKRNEDTSLEEEALAMMNELS